MNDIKAQLPVQLASPPGIVNCYHACEHLKRGCDASWGESTPENKQYFDRLKSKLKKMDDGAKPILRVLRFQSSAAKMNRIA